MPKQTRRLVVTVRESDDSLNADAFLDAYALSLIAATEGQAPEVRR